MKYKEQILEGFFLKRYKRFFTDIKIGNEIITAYCPNTGSLLGLLNENSKVLIAKVDNPKAKLKFRLEAIKFNETFVGVNTSLPNDIIFEAISNKEVLKNIQGTLKKEVKYGKNSRIDIYADNPNGNNSYIEIKSVTLSRSKQLSEFPDSVTSRGSKHLLELSEMSKKGNDCYLIYLVQRSDVTKFSIAKDIDQEYYENSLIAKKNGVKFFAYKCEVSKKGINIVSKLEINEN